MSIVAITSSRTSPGATTLACGLALAARLHHERTLLIEADPAGGVLAHRFGLGPVPSLATLGSDARHGFSPDLVTTNSQDLRGVSAIVGPVDPRLAQSWIQRVAPTLVQHLDSLDCPTVIDLGWIGDQSASLPLAAAASKTLVVTGTEVAEVQALLHQVRRLRALGASPAIVTVGDQPNDPTEVAALAGAPLGAVLPVDPKTAAALNGAKFSDRSFRRSLLWRTIGGLAQALFSLDQTPNPAPDPAPSNPQETVGSPAPAAQSTPPAVVVRPAPAPQAVAPATAPVPSASATAPATAPVPSASATAAATAPVPSASATAAATAPVPTPQVAFPAPVHASVAAPQVPSSAGAAPVGPNPLTVAELVFPSGARVKLDPHNPNVLGRRSDCAIVIPDSQVSRRHGSIRRTRDGWRYADMGSRNGTAVNDRPCTEIALEPGDEIRLGRARLVFAIDLNSPHYELELT